MGDLFKIRFNSLSTGSAPLSEAAEFSLGTKINPSFQLNWDKFFFELRPEFTASNSQRTPIGTNDFDSTPSSTLAKSDSPAKNSPLALWWQEPKEEGETFRGNFGLRSITAGYRMAKDLSLRLGPHRYDVTQMESLCMTNSFSPQCKFAFLSYPMGILGGEIKLEHDGKNALLKKGLVSVAFAQTGSEKPFLLAQGLLSFYLTENFKPPSLTVTGYLGLHSNPPNDERLLRSPGSTEGEGLMLKFEDETYNGAVALAHRNGESIDEIGNQENHERFALWMSLEYLLGDFLFHGNLAYLIKEDREGSLSKAPKNQTETNLELSAGYQGVKNLLLSLGYRAAFNRDSDTPLHSLFFGISTKVDFEFPFQEK